MYEIIEENEKDDAAAWAKWDAQALANQGLADEASRIGKPAFERLLALCESKQSGQIEITARFIAAIWNGARHFDFYYLRVLDREIASDMLKVFDMFAWGATSVDNFAANANVRIRRVLKNFNMD